MEKMSKTKVQMPAKLRGKLLAAISMLLVATIMMGSATFAWFTLSTAPEVKGMSTTVGSNGSLEIALQSTVYDENAQDYTLGSRNDIGTGTGDSRYADGGSWAKANLTWGNIVTLMEGASDPYNFGELSLYPATLHTAVDGDTIKVPVATPLYGPKYGVDGRVTTVDNGLAPRYFDSSNGGFVNALTTTGTMGYYGVKGIGTYTDPDSNAGAQTLSYSDLGATMASRVASNNQSAQDAIKNAIGNNVLAVSTLSGDAQTYSQNQVNGILGIISGLEQAIGYASKALGEEYLLQRLAAGNQDVTDVLGLSAGQVPTKRDIYNAYETMSLSDIATNATGTVKTAASDLNTIASQVQNARQTIEGARVGETYTATTVRSALNMILVRGGMYVNDTQTYTQAGGGNAVMTLAVDGNAHFYIVDGTGAVASIAKVIGDMSMTVTAQGITVPVEITKAATPAAFHADGYSNIGDILTYAGTVNPANFTGTLNYIQNAGEGTTYGYAVDLAFRSSTAANLKLQQAGIARVDGQTDENIIGEGSTVSFAYSNMDSDDALRVLSSIHVAFVDTDSGELFGIGYVTGGAASAGVAKGTLTLYTVATDGTPTLSPTQNLIASMTPNSKYYVSAIVYMDGNELSDVNIGASGQTVAINLQFATDEDLKPMEYSDWVGGAGTAEGLTYDVTVTAGEDHDALTVDEAGDADITWSSSNTDVVTVNETTGVIHGVAEGNATITATWTGGTKTFTVRVTAAQP